MVHGPGADFSVLNRDGEPFVNHEPHRWGWGSFVGKIICSGPCTNGSCRNYWTEDSEGNITSEWCDCW